MKHNINLDDYEIATTSPRKASVLPVNAMGLLRRWYDVQGVNGQRHMSDDDRMYSVEGRHGRFYFQSVIGYAQCCGDDPITNLERCRDRKENLWWLSEACAVIDGRAKPQTLDTLKVGGMVAFEGRLLRIKPTHNGNFELVQMNAARLFASACVQEASGWCDRIVDASNMEAVMHGLNFARVKHSFSGGPSEFVIRFRREDLEVADEVIGNVLVGDA